MLVLPPDRAHTIATPRRLGLRERWMVGGVLALAAAVLVVVAISLGSGGRGSASGCVDVNAPGATGGTELRSCGAQARELCASNGGSRARDGAFGAAVARECRRARLPVSP